jgi:hypothetical protein
VGRRKRWNGSFALASAAIFCLVGLHAAQRAGAATTDLPQSQSPSSVLDIVLTADSCVGSGFCFAVGYEPDSPDGNVPYSELWNGNRWTPEAVPSPGLGGTGNWLTSVSCTSPTACTALGGQFAERWNGTVWSLQGLQPLTTSSAVSCSTTTVCTAVGGLYRAPSQGTRPGAERWNGVSWTNQAIYAAADSYTNVLDAVSCIATQVCMAVGYQTNVTSSGYQHPLADLFDGTSWSLTHTVAVNDRTNISQLTGLSCTSTNWCAAVGFRSTDGDWGQEGEAQPLIEAWNGTTWTVQVTPTIQTPSGGQLAAVSCPSPVACIAIGNGSTSGGFLAEQWNGTSWQIQATPQLTGNIDSVHAISCGALSTCVAVGDTVRTTDPYRTIPLTELWNGTSWQILQPHTRATADVTPGVTENDVGSP